MQRLIPLGISVIAMNMALAAFMEQDFRSNKRIESVAPVFSQSYMNVFRRFSADPGDMYTFYGKILGFKQSANFKLGGNVGMAWFQIGDAQLKLTGVVPNRQYYHGDISEATGVRLLTFFFPDQDALAERFRAQGFPAPVFRPAGDSSGSTALVQDPDGQWVELVIIPKAPASVYERIEIGLVVTDIEASREFYREFVGLQELSPVDDEFLQTKKYLFRHGATTISLRSFGKDLPADTGSGGIQYVVSDIKAVERLAKAHNVTIDQPLNTMGGYSLQTIWTDDPDGITNYFAQVGAGSK
jgi:catechol 2,3-dioxygenase-like lactoylglutathione lyase family enzyme/predicted enzyme related to lactoylglutathione lyase